MSLKRICVSSFVFAVIFAFMMVATVCAQDTKSPKKPRPSLETDDVMPITTQVKTEKPAAPEAKPDAKTESKDDKKEGAKTEENGDPQKGETAKDGEKEGALKQDAAEIEWRTRMAAATEKVRQLRQQTQQSELNGTEIRNNRYGNNMTTDKLNAAAASMERNGQELSSLHQQLNAATQELEQIAEEGRGKKFHEEVKKPTTEKGAPNEEYYKARSVEFADQASDADRRFKILQYRVSELRAQLMGNGGKKGGDNFAGLQIQRELDQALIDMDLARSDYSKAQQALEALTEEARQAGLPAGTFRP